MLVCIPWCKASRKLSKALDLCRLPNALRAFHGPLDTPRHYHIGGYGHRGGRDNAQGSTVMLLWYVPKDAGQRWPGVRPINSCNPCRAGHDCLGWETS